MIRTLVRGTFESPQLKPLVFLLRSLCPDSGCLDEFRDWDRVYNNPPDVRGPKNLIRLRHHLVRPEASSSAGAATATATAASGSTSSGAAATARWAEVELRYLGVPDRRVAAPGEKRTVTTVGMGKEAVALLEVFGCVFQYEYVRKGVRCRTRQGFTVDVYIVEKMTKRHDVSKESLASLVDHPEQKPGVVEVISEEGASVDELMGFMKMLLPYVTLSEAPVKKGGR